MQEGRKDGRRELWLGRETWCGVQGEGRDEWAVRGGSERARAWSGHGVGWVGKGGWGRGMQWVGECLLPPSFREHTMVPPFLLFLFFHQSAPTGTHHVHKQQSSDVCKGSIERQQQGGRWVDCIFLCFPSSFAFSFLLLVYALMPCLALSFISLCPFEARMHGHRAQGVVHIGRTLELGLLDLLDQVRLLGKLPVDWLVC